MPFAKKVTTTCDNICKKLADFSGNDKKVFRFALLAGILLSLTSVFFMHDIYRDVANVYAYHAREIGSGNFKAGWVGRVPMLNILLSGLLAKISGLEAYRACIVISSLFYILTVFPLRRLLERYVSAVWSAWGCVLFVFAPKVIRFSVSGLLESGRYFFLTLAVLYYFRMAEEKFSWRNAVILGTSLAGLSVSRGEAMPIALLMLAGFPVFLLLKQWEKLSKGVLPKYLAGWLLAGTIFAIGLFPFCYGNWKFRQAFIPDLRLIQIASSKTDAALFATCPVVQPAAKKPEKNSRFIISAGNTLRGAYEPYFFLAVLGMGLLLYRKKWNWDFTLILGLLAVHFVIYYNTVAAYRYSIYLIPLFMPFTLTGVETLTSAIRSRLTGCSATGLTKIKILTGAGIAAVLLLQAINGMACVTDRKDRKIRKAAEFIRTYAAEQFPGRRSRIAAAGCVETIYWSGAVSLWGYWQYELPAEQQFSKDFDLYLQDKSVPGEPPAYCGELQEVPAPADLPVRIFRKKTENK